jgi:hypothetical protein
MFAALFFITILQSPIPVSAQSSDANNAAHETENRLKKAATKYFEEGDFIEAYPLYSQLLSLYPRDPNYNYRFGACLLFTKADKNKAVDYLEFSVKQSTVENLAYYYLGRALHLNYRFNEAIRSYKRYEQLASPSDLKKYPVKHFIEMCTSGKELLTELHGLDVMRKKELNLSDYFEAYDMHSNGGTLLSEPDGFKTKLDKSMNVNNIIYLTPDKKKAFFSSYGNNEKNGKDIYMVNRNPDGSWGTPQNLGNEINTPYDEDYPVYDVPHRTLYFCSKGHNSMGGYDIFKSVYIQSSNSWTEPVNLDFPVNSPDDDILFVPDTSGQTAYFASTRLSPQGTIDVYKIALHLHPPESVLVAGTAYSDNGKTPALCKISVTDIRTNKVVGVYMSSSQDGNYSFNLPNGGRYNFTIETSNHKPQSQTVVLPVAESMSTMKQDIKFDPSGDLQINSTPSELPKDSDYQLAFNYIKEQAQMDVNVDTNSIESLLAKSNASNQSNGAQSGSNGAESQNANNSSTVSATSGTGNPNGTSSAGNTGVNSNQGNANSTQQDPVQLTQDAAALNNKAAMAIDYASDKMEEAQQLQASASSIMNNASGGNSPDSASIARNLLNQANVSENKGIAAYQIAAEYKNEAATKQLEIENIQNLKNGADTGKNRQPQLNNQNTGNNNSEVSKARISPGDLVRRQAEQVKEDSFQLARSNDDLSQEITGLTQKSQEFVTQAGQTTDSQQKVALLQQADDLSKSKQEKGEQVKVNNVELLQMHNENLWLNSKARKVDSIFIVSSNNGSHVNNIDPGLQNTVQQEIADYAAANNYEDTNAVAPDNMQGHETNDNYGNQKYSSATGNNNSSKYHHKHTIHSNSSSVNNTSSTTETANTNTINQNGGSNSSSANGGNNGITNTTANNASAGNTNPSNSANTSEGAQNNPGNGQSGNTVSSVNNNSSNNSVSNNIANSGSSNSGTTNNNVTGNSPGNTNSAAVTGNQNGGAGNNNGGTTTGNGNNNSNSNLQAGNNSGTIATINGNNNNSNFNSQPGNNNGNAAATNGINGNTSQGNNTSGNQNTQTVNNGSGSNGVNGNNTATSGNSTSSNTTGGNQNTQAANNNSNFNGANGSNSSSSGNSPSTNNSNGTGIRQGTASNGTLASQPNGNGVSNNSSNSNSQSGNTSSSINQNSQSSNNNGNISSVNQNNNSSVTASQTNNSNSTTGQNSQQAGNNGSNSNTLQNGNNNNSNSVQNGNVNTTNTSQVSNINTSGQNSQTVSSNGNSGNNRSRTNASNGTGNSNSSSGNNGNISSGNNASSSDSINYSNTTRVRRRNNQGNNPSGSTELNSSFNNGNVNGGYETVSDYPSKQNNQGTKSNNANRRANNNPGNNSIPDSSNKDVSQGSEQANYSGNRNQDSVVSSSNSSLVLKTASIPVTFGYHKSNTPHDAFLDSLASAVPKSKVLESHSSKHAKNQPAYTVSTVQYTDTAAAYLNQKSENFFTAASMLVENAEKTRSKAQSESDKTKSEALYNKADSLDDLIFQLNLKGDENLAEANYRQYYTNSNQISSIEIVPDKNQAYKVTAAKRLLHDADNSYRRSMAERDRANNSRLLATKHTYIKSARQDLATAILRQQSAVYLYFQVDSDQTSSSMGRSNSDSSLHFTYAGFLNGKKRVTSSVSSRGSNNSGNPGDNSNSENVSPSGTVNNRNSEISSSEQPVNSSENSTNTYGRQTATQSPPGSNNNDNGSTSGNREVVPSSSDAGANNNNANNNLGTNLSAETEDIFKQLRRSPYSSSNPIPIDPPLPMGLIFKVQIGAFKNAIPQNLFKGFEPIIGLTATEGYIRYSAGLFRTFDPANVALGKIKNLGYPDAFIIAFFDGKRISMKEAYARLGITPPPIATSDDNTLPSNVQPETNNNNPATTPGKGKKKHKKGKGNNIAAQGTQDAGNNVASSGDNKVVIIGKNTIKPTKRALIDERKKALRAIKDTVPPASKPIRDIKGLVYTVQVGSFPKHKDFIRLRKMKKLYSSIDETGAIKYNCGTYNSIADAKSAKEIILANTNVKDAFIAAYYNGKRISLTKASDLLNKGVDAANSAPVEPATNNTNNPVNNSAPTAPEKIATPVNTANPATDNTNKTTEGVKNNSFEEASKTRVIYTVQIASFSGELPVDTANKILMYASEGIEPYQEKHGLTTYYAGKFTDIESANALQQKLINQGFKQAFIVAYYLGKKISLQEAQSINNK